MRLRFRVLVSDEVQQAPRLSDLSAPPSPASCDGEVWKNTPPSFRLVRVVEQILHIERDREMAREGWSESESEMESPDTCSTRSQQPLVKAESEKRANTYNHFSTCPCPCFMHACILAAACSKKPKSRCCFLPFSASSSPLTPRHITSI